jgi:LacI family transcriptional regulator
MVGSVMATIKDVAREAGVSVATVSRVFNESERVSVETERAVRAVAGRLDYWPNAAARSLITSRTHALGVLLPDLYGEFFSEVIRGIDLAARREGFHLLVSSSHSDTDALVAALRSLRGRIDALIAMAPDRDAPAAITACTGALPVVLLNPPAAGCDTVSLANFDGAYTVVRHLVALGHTRIATITGPARNGDAQQRLDGYHTALRDAGIEPSPVLEIHGDFTEASGSAAAAQIMQRDPLPTAVFAANDYMALGFLSALRDARVRVPERMAVTGFDDIAIARYLDPPLTTVRVDAFALGERAVQRLLASGRLRHLETRHEILPATLVVRRSCGSTEPRTVLACGPAKGNTRPRSSVSHRRNRRDGRTPPFRNLTSHLAPKPKVRRSE